MTYGYGELNIIEDLTKNGLTAISTNKGFPDIFSIIDDVPVWIEVKNNKKQPLRKDQVKVMEELSQVINVMSYIGKKVSLSLLV